MAPRVFTSCTNGVCVCTGDDDKMTGTRGKVFLTLFKRKVKRSWSECLFCFQGKPGLPGSAGERGLHGEPVSTPPNASHIQLFFFFFLSPDHTMWTKKTIMESTSVVWTSLFIAEYQQQLHCFRVYPPPPLCSPTAPSRPHLDPPCFRYTFKLSHLAPPTLD